MIPQYIGTKAHFRHDDVASHDTIRRVLHWVPKRKAAAPDGTAALYGEQ
jgi:hypothetical protein